MIDIMFMSILYSNNLSQHRDKNEYFYKKVLEIKEKNKNTPQKSGWICDTFNTDGLYDLYQDPVFQPILQDIKSEVLKFSKEFGQGNDDIMYNGGWINLAPPGAYQEYHVHGNSHFSIVYYIDVPNNSGDIVFLSPEATVADMYPLPKEEKVTYAGMKTFKFKPAANDLLIFRSNVMHMVNQNKSNRDRISISINFTF